MTTQERAALAQRLEDAELDLQGAMHGLDGSPEARTRLAEAREEHRAVEAHARVVLALQETSAAA
ncbi:hypothetical protein D7V80_11780 [Corallococcus sp. CA054B]|uniref:hypothetical protein n=1 Tax=Corallococcus sp. CA054B TaxID=2316734 RepID=UPI000EA1AC82|nr:hypothetical protein [Corallococcus sp. CA054B]RKG68670.1 hypothetical protein D7V80_11780 [Corallococcus sp. CA054B]